MLEVFILLAFHDRVTTHSAAKDEGKNGTVSDDFSIRNQDILYITLSNASSERQQHNLSSTMTSNNSFQNIFQTMKTPVHSDLDVKRKVMIDRLSGDIAPNDDQSLLIGRAFVNLATHMPSKSGIYIIQYVRLSEPLSMQSSVTVISESPPFNFVFRKQLQ